MNKHDFGECILKNFVPLVAADCADVKGKRVLDMGPASGFFSFYLEQLGAEVTVLESRGYGDFDVYGVDRYTGAQKRRPDRLPLKFSGRDQS